MSHKYSITFLFLAVACGFAGARVCDFAGWITTPFAYAAFSFLLVAVAYGGAGAGLLLKRRSGRQPFTAWLMFAPYFLLNHASLALGRLLTREPAFGEVIPNLFFGRRLLGRECTGARWVSVLDLAGEFAEVRPLRMLPGYRSLPILDATAPNPEQLRFAVAWLANAVAVGPVYVHCALGHGRSACIVIAYLLSIGRVRTVSEGVQLLRSLRSGVRLNQSQRQALQPFQRGSL